MDENPESSTPAKYPPVISKPESHPPQNESFNWFPFSVRCFPCFRVGGSFRSGVQPPTGSGVEGDCWRADFITRGNGLMECQASGFAGAFGGGGCGVLQEVAG